MNFRISIIKKNTMEKQKKIYCGSGKKKSENWFQITLNPEKFSEHIKEYNGNRYIKLNVNILPEPDKYGKELSVSIDTWEPTNRVENKVSAPKDDNLDLPF